MFHNKAYGCITPSMSSSSILMSVSKRSQMSDLGCACVITGNATFHTHTHTDNKYNTLRKDS